jgi:hypothetical protein
MEIMESFLLRLPFYNGVLTIYMCANFSEDMIQVTRRTPFQSNF